MKAITVHPGQPDSLRLRDVPEPPLSDGSVLVETLAVGVCGTDAEIIQKGYGKPPSGDDYLILGHESLGRVLEAPRDSGFKTGDHVVGIVRRPDPVPCVSCAHGDWDMCRNGRYTERGIKERHGFGSERFRSEPEFLVQVDPQLAEGGVLLETASVIAKGWEHIEHIGRRATWEPRRALITGAGPVGLMAVLMGRQRDLEVAVFDQHTDGPKPALVKEIGGHYYHQALSEIGPDPDIVIECTGAVPVVLETLKRMVPVSIVCLTGVSSGKRVVSLDMAGFNQEMVLENGVVFGSVNANRRHYEKAADALRKADPGWLRRMITRKVPLSELKSAYSREPNDVKAVVQFQPIG